MSQSIRKQLAHADWPYEDRCAWNLAFKTGELFDHNGPGAHLAPTTREALHFAYAGFLGFLTLQHPILLDRAPASRVDREIVGQFVDHLRASCRDVTIVTRLHHLRLALRLICPELDWTWLLIVTKRLAAQAQRHPDRHHLVTSDRLYALGFELMERAVERSKATGSVSIACPLEFRDGLIIALLAAVPLRRRTLAALRIGKHLVKHGDIWAIDIPAQDAKARRPLDYPVSIELSEHIDVYLGQFRKRIPGANDHDGLWASSQGRPLHANAIASTIGQRTRSAFGFPVNLHRFRHAAATFWSMRDPANVRGAKDLLGHASFGMTEKYYVMAQSRIAGRALASAIDGDRNRS
jgi:integrase